MSLGPFGSASSSAQATLPRALPDAYCVRAEIDTAGAASASWHTVVLVGGSGECGNLGLWLMDGELTFGPKQHGACTSSASGDEPIATASGGSFRSGNAPATAPPWGRTCNAPRRTGSGHVHVASRASCHCRER